MKPSSTSRHGIGQASADRLESGLDLLANGKTFNRLRSLDLADNDLYELKHVVEALAPLTQLLYLLLEGNPCSVVCSYKNEVLVALPNLLYLDNKQILEDDRTIVEPDQDYVKKYENINAAFVFTCHRIMVLPAPPKQKGITQTFYWEISLPLLEETIIEPEIEECVEVDKKTGDKKKGAKKKDKNKKSSKKGKGSKKSKKGKAPSPYEADDEYEKECKMNIKNYSFQTERFAWSKVIQLPEEALVIESNYGNLTDIRDTFRTSVNVKLIYLKIEPPKKKGKEKKGKKDKKKKGKKDKKGKGDKKSKKGDKEAKQSEPKIELPPEEPKETILKKVTLANFWCDLSIVNWSDKTNDFYWADHPKSKPKAIPVTGSLRSIIYNERAGGKGKKEKKEKKDPKGKKGKDAPPTTETTNIIEAVVNPLDLKQDYPKMFTCQIGIGLLRNYKQNNVIV